MHDGKHKDGKCQRDFVCQHPYHSKYPTRKHVLVCDEHKDHNENKELFQHYKERFILKQRVDLPSFSKDLKLSFYTSHHFIEKNVKESLTQQEETVTEKGIYQLQVITDLE